MLSQEKIKELKKFGIEIRKQTIYEIACLGVGHVGGSLSISELMACLYGHIMNVDPKNPKWDKRDRFVMSKGHAGPAMYAALALKGFFPMEELETLNKPGTRLPSHTDMTKTPGVDMTTGSLGQGMSSATGMALAGKLDNKDHYVYCLLGDGEIDEGQCYEAFQFAAQQNLDNLIVFLDKNEKQLDDTTDKCLSLRDINAKLEAFGWDVHDVKDGHDVAAICEAVEASKAAKGKPSFITLHTIKGKDFPQALRIPNNHNMPVTMDNYKEACELLDKQIAELG